MVLTFTNGKLKNLLKMSLRKIWRYLRRPQTIFHDMDLSRDFYEFKQKYNFLSDPAASSAPGKKVLIVSLTDWIAQIKMEGMLAKALQIKGFTPVIVTNRSCQRAIKYFRVFGYNEFIFFDELLAATFKESLLKETQALLSTNPSFKSLCDFKYRGVDTGRHVLSAITRSLRHGSIEFSNPQVKELLTECLPRSMQAVLAAELLFDKVEPAITLFLEKGYTPYGEIFDVSVNRGVDTIQFMRSHRSDALALKRYHRGNRHLHPFSLSEETWKQVKEMPWTELCEQELMKELKGRYENGTWFNRKYLQVGKKIKSSAEVRSQLGLDPHKKTAVIFSHVLWDATFFYGESLFNDYEEWLVETVKVASENAAVNWIIKLHPDYVWKMKQMGSSAKPRDLLALQAGIGELPPHIHIVEPDTDISTYSLFEVTDYCLTVRGTIGIEMPCFGIPVFTAGTGRYSGLGFTIDSQSREEYLSRIEHILDFPRLNPEQTLLAKKHAYALFKLRPCPFKTFEMVQMPLNRLGHPLDHNVVIRAKRIKEISQAADMNTFAEWITDSHNVDFLMPFQKKEKTSQCVGS